VLGRVLNSAVTWGKRDGVYRVLS